ncbi:hypothetical protein HRS9122_08082 [Pyrenophora teres f. teres]|nr:hypothetical protein HRS9122_08082 [Pyrenophora teres f. teres]
MEQTKALNALEPFLALSKSATSPRAASDLVVQATSAPNTYVFAELLQTPNIQNLTSSEEYRSHLTLLEIFAWGTWADYKGAAHPRALEELITTAIYSGLITATLDPAHSLVSVTSISPLRDLAPGSLPALQNTLSLWSERCGSALADLEAQVAKVKKEALDREKLRRKKERALEAAMQANDEKNNGKRTVTGMGGDDAMDIDDEGSSGRVTRGSKRVPGSFGFGNLGRR